MFEADLAYLEKQLAFAASARTQVGLHDALGRARDAIARIRAGAADAERRMGELDRNLDSLLAFAESIETPTDAEVEAMFAD